MKVLSGYKVYILGFIVQLTGVFTLLGWLTPEDKDAIDKAMVDLIEHVSAAAFILGGLYMWFQRAATKKAETAAKESTAESAKAVAAAMLATPPKTEPAPPITYPRPGPPEY